jgi:hypothetical protein
MKCPVCETENSEDAAECSNCGKQLALDGDVLEDVEAVPGLELTLQERVDTDAAPLPGLELTQVADKDLRVPDEKVPGVEHTQLEEDPEAPVNWSPGSTPIDSGREQDDGVRTPAPQDTGTCPWCGAPAEDAVCDSCGRRRSRYTAAAPVAAAEESGDIVMCPACFSRVPHTLRCQECGSPFPLQEL